MTTKKSVLAWHFIGADRRMANVGEVIEPGYIYSHVGPLELCRAGMHASVRAIDAIKYAPGPVVCRVRCSGEMLHESDKLVAQHREVLWMADASSILRLIACECVRKTPLADGRTVWDLLTDPRSRNAVEVAERYAHGKATDQERAAAWDAAWTVAWDAAGAAAWDAAWTVAWDAARGAAREAAWAAAWTVAWDAAWAAAWEAAREAAWAAAREAAWEAAWGAQNDIATKLLMTLGPRGAK